MIRLTQSICTALRGLSWIAHDPMNATTTATTFTVSWNWRNLAMESYTLRPHITAFTMLVKLSSVRMMSEASFATSVPAIPMAKPTSAFLRAGASFLPSPVTATTSLPADNVLSMIPLTSVYLSMGCDLANTLNLGHILS